MAKQYIPVCMNNNQLAALYSVMATGDARAKFLTGEDLQFLAALISYHYSKDSMGDNTSFTVERGIVSRATPRFCAMPYRLEKERYGESFVYSSEFVKKYRGLYQKCIDRFGKLGEQDTNEDRTEFAYLLENMKENDEYRFDPLVYNLYAASNMQVLDEVKYREFLDTSSTRTGVSVQQATPLTEAEKLEWVNSQFYIMKNLNPQDAKRMEDELIDLYAEFFNTGLPYIFYYQQARLNSNIGIKLKFGDKEKERFKEAVKAAIEDFAKTSRVKINNEAYGQLQSIMQQGQESIF